MCFAGRMENIINHQCERLRGLGGIKNVGAVIFFSKEEDLVSSFRPCFVDWKMSTSPSDIITSFRCIVLVLCGGRTIQILYRSKSTHDTIKLALQVFYWYIFYY